MLPIYAVAAWQEPASADQDHPWWLARVVAASTGADPSPLRLMTQAKTPAEVHVMVRDLIATVLDTDEDSFVIQVEYLNEPPPS